MPVILCECGADLHLTADRMHYVCLDCNDKLRPAKVVRGRAEREQRVRLEEREWERAKRRRDRELAEARKVEERERIIRELPEARHAGARWTIAGRDGLHCWRCLVPPGEVDWYLDRRLPVARVEWDRYWLRTDYLRKYAAAFFERVCEEVGSGR